MILVYSKAEDISRITFNMGRNELGLKWLSKKLYRAGTFSIASLYSYRFNILYVLEN